MKCIMIANTFFAVMFNGSTMIFEKAIDFNIDHEEWQYCTQMTDKACDSCKTVIPKLGVP